MFQGRKKNICLPNPGKIMSHIMITNFFYRWSSFDIKFVLGYMPFFTINIPRNQTLNEAENTELLGLQKVLSRVFNISKSFQRKYLWKQFSFERASVAKMASQNTKDDPDFRYAFLWSNTLCPFFFFFRQYGVLEMELLSRCSFLNYESIYVFLRKGNSGMFASADPPSEPCR